jgi:hypothetical protein
MHIAHIAASLKREKGVGNELSSYYRLNRLSKGKYTLIMCIVLGMYIATALIMTVSASVSLLPMTLTIVGPNGTQVVLHETDIGNMASYRAVGGRINKVGTIGGVGNYTGVPINTFCNLVGGLHPSQTLRVTASDNYTQTFTYAQVNGNFTTYNATKYKVPHYQPLTTILAYYFNDGNISYSSGGPLRFAIVGPEGLITNSSYWVQHVVKLEILGTVGGYWIPVNKIDLLAPYIGAVTIVLVGTVAVGVYWKRNQRKKKQ